MTAVTTVEDLLRELAPQVLGALARRFGDLADAEDAVQEALLAGATQWPVEGVPDDPRAWLTTVATRRMTDRLRRDGARRRRRQPPLPASWPSRRRCPIATTRCCCSSSAANRR